MCFGFNTDDSCEKPLNNIVLFKNNVVTVDCDNCFSGLAGDLFINMEIHEFHLLKIQFGLKNIHLRGGLGVTVDSYQSWAYAYSKLYHIIDKAKIVSFSIGPIKIEIYLDFPVHVDFTAYSTFHNRINYGVNMDMNIGDLYVEYYKGKWKTVTPNPSMFVHPYLKTLGSIDSVAHFAIVPQLLLYSPRIFTLDLKFDPYCDLVTTSSLATKNACINGNYDLRLVLSSSVLNEKLPEKIIYESGLIPFVEKCINF
jgi:hypothetical protein